MSDGSLIIWVPLFIVVVMIVGHIVFKVITIVGEYVLQRIDEGIETLIEAVSEFIIRVIQTSTNVISQAFKVLAQSLLRFFCQLTINLITAFFEKTDEELTLWSIYLKHGNGGLGSYWAFRSAVRQGDDDNNHDEEETRKEEDMCAHNELSYPKACELFGLPGNESFDQHEFKQCFRRYMGRYHPDKCGGSNQMAQAINEAANVIKKRRKWK